MISNNSEYLYYFNSIVTKGKKDNTYKFALARFLVEFSYGLDEQYIENAIKKNRLETIRLSTISRSFLKYYWHQICKYKIKQNYNTDKLPLIVQIIHSHFGTQYNPESFESMNRDKTINAVMVITKKFFLEIFPWFQNFPDGVKVYSKKSFMNLIKIL